MAEWWAEPQRIVQTNLRLTDASMDPREVARDARRLGATAIFFNVGASRRCTRLWFISSSRS